MTASNSAESRTNVDRLIEEAGLVENSKNGSDKQRGAKSVPSQVTPEVLPDEADSDKDNATDGEANTPKKSLKDRLNSLGEKAKEHKNVIIAVGAAVSVAAIAFGKYAKEQAKKQLDEQMSDEDKEAFENAKEQAEQMADFA